MKAPECAKCKQPPCHKGITKKTKLPEFCPIKNFPRLTQQVSKRYFNEEIQDFFLKSALTEKECYDVKAVREEGRLGERSLELRVVGTTPTWFELVKREVNTHVYDRSSCGYVNTHP